MTHYRLEQVEKEKRYYQDEWLISQYTGQHFELGQHIGFITVLVPHSSDDDPKRWVDRIKFVASEDQNKGLSVEIQFEEQIIQIGIKCDLRMDMIRDYRRPKYTYEAGRIRYGKFETNGDFFFANRNGSNLSYTVVNVSKAFYDNQMLFSQPSSVFGLAFNGSSDESGFGKARYWRDEVVLK